MLQKRDSEMENRMLEELINTDPQIRKQHELFQEEMRFKQMLIDARKATAMTQKDISERSGLSQQAVSRLEKGHGGTVDTVLKYLNAIGFTLALKKI